MPSATQKIHLTQDSVKRLKPAASAKDKYIVKDDKLPGFMVLVGVDSKSFRLETERRINGKRVAISRGLGRWPETSVERAREEVAKIMG